MDNWKTEIHFKETPVVNRVDGHKTNSEISGDKVTPKAKNDMNISEITAGGNNKEIRKRESKKHYVRETYRQGDIVVIDFGQSSDRRSLSGRRPCVLVSRNEVIRNAGQIQVIPLYRSEPGKPKEDRQHENDVAAIPRLYGMKNIFISKKVCSGLHYDMYLQPVSVQLVSKHRIQRKIGRIRENVVICEIVDSIWNAIGRELTEKGAN